MIAGRSAGDDLGELGAVAQRREVVIVPGECGQRRQELDGPPKMGQRRLDPPRPSLGARGVVVQRPERRVARDERLGAIGALLVVARLEQRKQRGEQLPPGSDSSCSLMIRSPSACAVDAITPNAMIPK